MTFRYTCKHREVGDEMRISNRLCISLYFAMLSVLFTQTIIRDKRRLDMIYGRLRDQFPYWFELYKAYCMQNGGEEPDQNEAYEIYVRWRGLW